MGNNDLEITNADLRLSDLPKEGDWNALNRFAHTYNGCREYGGYDRCADVAKAVRDRFASDRFLPDSLDELRGSLFYEHRAMRMDFGTPLPETKHYLASLLFAIREIVASSENSPLANTVEDKLQKYRQEASQCVLCRADGLLHRASDNVWARPLFHHNGTVKHRILFVFEAPNYSDTFDPDKGYMTCCENTDPTGRFFAELLEHIGIIPEDVVITNAVLCLPQRKNGKHPVAAAQVKLCLHWLERLIETCDAEVVVTCGEAALRAAKLIYPHNLTLARDVGVVTSWGTRNLLPLYHPSSLGRVTRSGERQLKDIEALKPYLNVPQN